MLCRVAVAAMLIASTLSASAAVAKPMEDRAGRFVVQCAFSHRLSDDPIVVPNQPGRSHSHDFFGNRGTDAHSTESSMLQGGTTCRGRPDSSGYWFPTLLEGHHPIRPVEVFSYYLGQPQKPTAITAFPPGFRMVAGDAKATTRQSRTVTSWLCRSVSGIAEVPSPSCGDGEQLRLRVIFPNCWDGVRLDSATHKDHVTESVDGSCPDSHPVAIPRLWLVVSYASNGGPDATLASGGKMSAHADFFNGWNQDMQHHLVRTCIHDRRSCSAVEVPAETVDTFGLRRARAVWCLRYHALGGSTVDGFFC